MSDIQTTNSFERVVRHTVDTLKRSGWPVWGLGVAILIALSARDYLAFHTLIEAFLVFIAMLMWAIAWQTHRLSQTGILVVLANGYLFVGLLTLGHAFTSGGSMLTTAADSAETVAYWLATRLLEALVMLMAPLCLRHPNLRKRSMTVFGSLAFVLFLTVQGAGAYFGWNSVEDLGSTRIWGETLIVGLMVAALVHLWIRRDLLSPDTLGLLLLAIVLSIASETLLAVTMEAGRVANVVAHTGVFTSFWVIFAVVLGKGVREPYAAMAQEVDRRRIAELELARLNAELEERVAERTRDLERSERSLIRAQRIAGLGSWEWEIGADILHGSDELRQILGMDADRRLENFGDFLAFAHVDDRTPYEQAIGLVRQTGDPMDVRLRIVQSDGSLRHVHSHAEAQRDDQGRVVKLNGTLQDVTEDVLIKLTLHENSDRLEQSNAELQQFAYAVSHDLQEPLRMVASYVQLLAQRYKGRFDSDADEFIDYTLDGAKRMQAMIRDLLEYSRVQTRGTEPEPTDVGHIVDKALANLAFAIEEADAQITVGDMPAVQADPGQLMRVFQNLIGNAIKYRQDGVTPQISVSAEPQGGLWLFRIRDNGIGIGESNFERIFGVFQRLHARDAYEGTGIGLALCKRIVDRHGGRIWVESETGQGSTFLFTVPAARDGGATPSPDVTADA